MVVLMADEDPFGGAAHAVKGVVILQAAEAGVDGWVFFWLRWERLDGWVGGLKVGWWYGRHGCSEPRGGLKCRVGGDEGLCRSDSRKILL